MAITIGLANHGCKCTHKFYHENQSSTLRKNAGVHFLHEQNHILVISTYWRMAGTLELGLEHDTAYVFALLRALKECSDLSNCSSHWRPYRERIH